MSSYHNLGKPQHCGKKMQRLYIRKGTKDRRWITVGYYCNLCRKMIRDSDLILHRRSEVLTLRPDLVDSITKPQKIVLDIGEKLTKAGFAGEKTPRLLLDSVLYFDENNKSFIQNSEYVEITRIVKAQRSIFNNYENQNFDPDTLEHFLDHVFETLGVNPEDKSIMITEKNYKNNYVEALYGRREEINNLTLPEDVRENLKKKPKVEFADYEKYVKFPRRQLTSILFDSFNIARIYFSNGDLLSLYANDMVTGIVVNIGSESTRIIPVFQGFIVTHAISVRDIGTNHILKKIIDYFDIHKKFEDASMHLKYLIQKRLRLASEDFCYASLNPSSEQNRWLKNEKLKKHVNLYNDEYVLFDQIRYQVTESLFEKEELSTTKRKGTLVDAVIESIQKCYIDLGKALYANILLTGGGSFYEGLKERFEAELREKVGKHIEFNVHAKSNRLISSWIGGSILSILQMFENRKLWVSKEEYNEKGSLAVDRCI